jgi:hypothetical protein
MMSDGSGRTLRPLSGTWTHVPGCSCSRTSLGCSLLEAGTFWPVSFTDWPASGTWDATGFSGPLTSARPITASAGSALLPTPDAGSFNEGESLESWEARRQANLAKGINGNGQGTPLSMAVKMLPTPNATDFKGAGQPPGTIRDGRERPASDADLPTAVQLLPTPRATRRGSVTERWLATSPGAVKHGRTLEEVLLLPTPSRHDYKGSPGVVGDRMRDGRQRLEGDMDLREALLTSMPAPMMPTPQSRDYKGAPGKGSRERGGHQGDLTIAITGGPTPQPSRTGKRSSAVQHPGQLSLDDPETG